MTLPSMTGRLDLRWQKRWTYVAVERTQADVPGRAYAEDVVPPVGCQQTTMRYARPSFWTPFGCGALITMYNLRAPPLFGGPEARRLLWRYATRTVVKGPRRRRTPSSFRVTNIYTITRVLPRDDVEVVDIAPTWTSAWR